MLVMVESTFILDLIRKNERLIYENEKLKMASEVRRDHKEERDSGYME